MVLKSGNILGKRNWTWLILCLSRNSAPYQLTNKARCCQIMYRAIHYLVKFYYYSWLLLLNFNIYRVLLCNSTKYNNQLQAQFKSHKYYRFKIILVYRLITNLRNELSCRAFFQDKQRPGPRSMYQFCPVDTPKLWKASPVNFLKMVIKLPYETHLMHLSKCLYADLERLRAKRQTYRSFVCEDYGNIYTYASIKVKFSSHDKASDLIFI